MASKLSDSNGRKNTTLLIGIGVVVAIVALVVVTPRTAYWDAYYKVND